MKRQFRVHVSQAKLNDLKRRLARTRWPDSPEAAEWDLGTSLPYMQGLVSYWQQQFSWRLQEEAINAFDHFKMDVDEERLHFVHQTGRGPNPIPLLMIHGWPGSFWEMHRILPMLADPEKFGADAGTSFDVVVPSLPGYGFSGRPAQMGMNGPRIAELFAKLMKRLGYPQFLVQGGDWGATVATWLGLNHPERLIGIHLNYIPGSYRPYTEPGENLSAAEQEFLQQKDEWYRQEGAYAHIQATRPQTLAYALNDSPAGLAAWILEKLRGWSDCNGNVESRFSKDELLTQICIYWFTETFHSSARLYYEGIRRPVALVKGQQVEVPTAVARFPLEVPMPPREWVERGYNIVRWTEMPRGGHFAAWEEPELLFRDICAFARR